MSENEMTTEVETIRTAAARMRVLADAATTGPWSHASVDGQGFAVHRGEHTTVALYANRDDAEFIAAADPPFVRAVADWLEAEADFQDETNIVVSDQALAVARTFLGDADA